MSYDSWTCLMVNKGPGVIDEDVRAALKKAACELNLKRWDTMHISNNVCTGLIKTQWTTHRVGARSGVLFRAQVEGEKGEYQVNFLLSEDDLNRGADLIREMEEGNDGVWVPNGPHIPLDELYQFYDLTETRRLN